MTLAEPRNDCSENARTAGSALIEITDDDVLPAGPSSPVAVMIETPAGWFRHASTQECRMDRSSSPASSAPAGAHNSFSVHHGTAECRGGREGVRRGKCR